MNWPFNNTEVSDILQLCILVWNVKGIPITFAFQSYFQEFACQDNFPPFSIFWFQSYFCYDTDLSLLTTPPYVPPPPISLNLLSEYREPCNVLLAWTFHSIWPSHRIWVLPVHSRLVHGRSISRGFRLRRHWAFSLPRASWLRCGSCPVSLWFLPLFPLSLHL